MYMTNNKHYFRDMGSILMILHGVDFKQNSNMVAQNCPFKSIAIFYVWYVPTETTFIGSSVIGPCLVWANKNHIHKKLCDWSMYCMCQQNPQPIGSSVIGPCFVCANRNHISRKLCDWSMFCMCQQKSHL